MCNGPSHNGHTLFNMSQGQRSVQPRPFLLHANQPRLPEQVLTELIIERRVGTSLRRQLYDEAANRLSATAAATGAI